MFLTLASLSLVLWMLAVVSAHFLGGQTHLLPVAAGAFALLHARQRDASRRERADATPPGPSTMQARLALGRQRVPAYLSGAARDPQPVH